MNLKEKAKRKIVSDFSAHLLKEGYEIITCGWKSAITTKGEIINPIFSHLRDKDFNNEEFCKSILANRY